MSAKRARDYETKRMTFVAPHATPEWLYFAYGPDIIVPMIEVEADVLDTSEKFPEWMPLSEQAQKSYRDALSMEPRAAQSIYFRAASGRDDLEAELLQAIGVRKNGSPVWWVDLDSGPVQVASLYDLQKLATKPQPWRHGPRRKKAVMWLLSLEQWETATFPPASKGGPPFVKGVSTAAERRKRKRTG